jgi:hypothetical protein
MLMRGSSREDELPNFVAFRFDRNEDRERPKMNPKVVLPLEQTPCASTGREVYWQAKKSTPTATVTYQATIVFGDEVKFEQAKGSNDRQSLIKHKKKSKSEEILPTRPSNESMLGWLMAIIGQPTGCHPLYVAG